MRLAWLGIATSDYTLMLSFLRDTLALQVEFDEPSTAELSLPNDDRRCRADVVGDPDSDDNWTWIHVRAPDGNLYEFASRRWHDPD